MPPIARRPLLAGLLALPAIGRAEDRQAERWRGLRFALFADRPVELTPAIQLQAPAQAADAAEVPVAIRIAPELGAEVTALSLVVDENPEPLALVARGANLRWFATRIRVDATTRLHAVAETRAGRLLAAQAFVAASGGCSAPAQGDPREGRNRMGGIRLRLPEGPPSALRAVPVDLAVHHPNSSGLQQDPLTRAAVPAEWVRQVGVSYREAEVLLVRGSVSLAENPSFGFALGGAPGGALRVTAEDSAARQFGSNWVLGVA